MDVYDHFWIFRYGDRCDSHSELYNSFLQDTGISKSQKAFSEDIVKCNINERKSNGDRLYVGLIRK